MQVKDDGESIQTGPKGGEFLEWKDANQLKFVGRCLLSVVLHV